MEWMSFVSGTAPVIDEGAEGLLTETKATLSYI